MAPRRKLLPVEEIAFKLTQWVGSTSSILVHTFLFGLAVAYGVLTGRWDEMLLILTTVVSLEAIYLAIFIQMTVNRNTESLEVVEENIDEIQEDVGELQEDVAEIQEDDVPEGQTEAVNKVTLEQIQTSLQQLLQDVEKFRAQK